MTIEEKAKAYDEAIKRAKEINNEQRAQPFDVMTRVFSELRESKDEKIKQRIIKLIKMSNEVGGFALHKWEADEMLAWLEKQKEPELSKDLGDYIAELSKQFPEVSFAKLSRIAVRVKNWLEKQDEQKPTDKQKFEIGDEIKTDNEDPLTITKINEQGYWSGDLFICSFEDSAKWELVGKRINKLEHKFHKGDWVIHQGTENIYQVVARIDNQYQLKYGDNYTVQKCADVDRCSRLWDVAKDARNGDVLASELCDSIILFKGIKDDNIDFYCDYDFSKINIPGDRFAVNNGQHYGNVEDSKDFHPATKEQRDTLFSKMHEAGYEWNAEKKELKKIEQKPQRMVSAEAKEALYDKPTDEEMKELLRTEYEKGRADTIAEMKSSWSEEDVKKIDRAIWLIEHDASHGWIKELREDVISGLKSLKQKIKL